jgi:RsiW-degrading membrane proteinase PrsW (M82 family)
MALIVAPVVLVSAVLTAIEPHHYPPGDFRNEPIFWVVFAVVAVTLALFLVIGSIHEVSRRR